MGYPDGFDYQTQLKAVNLINAERQRQETKFGNQDDNSPQRWLQILMEEVGEWCDADLQAVELAKHDTPEEAFRAAFEELVQIAAVAQSWVESALRTGYGQQ